jgi:formate--tetrahydrofolate ligase
MADGHIHANQHQVARSDADIAQAAHLRPIVDVAWDKLGIAPEHLSLYGSTKAKLNLSYIETLTDRPDGKLILVTAITPTPAGEGKTTTTVGLTDALNHIGKKATACLREPSLGPCFGVKGGAAGGGFAQVVPMEDINLHFTGDFHAIGAANNLLAAMLDNHIYWGNELDIDPRRISWKRAIDMNDRALRSIVSSLGGVANGYPREDAFDIVVASEVMAIFCLSKDVQDLQTRLGNIIVGYTKAKTPVRAADLQAAGSMAVLLRDALAPNLVQTLEHNPAFIHGGPFANIAHGCNSVIATRTALKLSDYVVTEAGFGADLGAEKFFDIKCRKAGLSPSVAVVVATIRALKMHGGVAKDALKHENVEALRAGFANLARHIGNVGQFGVPKVVETIETKPAHFRTLYPDDMKLADKVRTIATQLYGAADIALDSGAKSRLAELEKSGFGHLPVCIAKTQYSFSTDGKAVGAPSGHVIPVREVRLSAGAEFVVVVCGDIMTMPGLPRIPAAANIKLTPDGTIAGLF